MAAANVYPLSRWSANTLNNATPANDNALRVEVLTRPALSVLSAQPGSPSDGDVHIIGAAPSGAQWSGFDEHDVAVYYSGTWYAFIPFDGWIKKDIDSGDTLEFNGAAWAPLAGSGVSVTQTKEMMTGFFASPSDKDYRIVVKAAHAGTITETTTRSASGTCTATFKINATALGGTANSVSSSEQSQAHSTSNAFAEGDDIVITISSNSSCADMSFTIKYTRTLE